MDMNMMMDAELRIATAEATCEMAQAEMEKCMAECNALKVENASLKATLVAERGERARSDAVTQQFIAMCREMMQEETQVQPEWEFRVQRDGANQMIGVTAIPRSE